MFLLTIDVWGHNYSNAAMMIIKYYIWPQSTQEPQLAFIINIQKYENEIHKHTTTQGET